MALPTYTMSCFLLPKTICKQIASLLAEFWWKNSKEKRGMHWKTWDHLSRPKSDGGLGFKDIEAFNISLLGKQLWRLMVQKNSLIARVYKARYYQNSTPLNASLGSRPSYAWRSIHAAQRLIKEGARVVVGNGQDTNLWEEPWIGSKPAHPLCNVNWIDPRNYQLVSKITKVSDLMLPNGREWNMSVISELVSRVDRRKIEELRLGGAKCLDGYCWDYSRTGHYTVKSGYWVYTNVLNNGKPAKICDQPSLSPIYSLIWEADASPKIHHFLWKCISNCLPTADNLHRRHILREAECARCHTRKETVNHMLFQCSFARQVWALSPLPAPPNGEWSNSLYDNFYKVMTLQPKYPYEKEVGKISPWILWRLWKNRNDLVMKATEFDALQVVCKAMEDKEEWNSSVHEEVKISEGSLPMVRVNRWKPPPENWLKCNVDGAWSENSNHSGIGWILRDRLGKPLWMGARRLPKLKSALEAEAEALRWAMRTVKGFNYQHVIFESDSKSWVQALNEDVTWPVLNGIQQDTIQLKGQEDLYRVTFANREANVVADRIAKESISFESNDPRLYSLMPRWIIPMVEFEKQLY